MERELIEKLALHVMRKSPTATVADNIAYWFEQHDKTIVSKDEVDALSSLDDVEIVTDDNGGRRLSFNSRGSKVAESEQTATDSQVKEVYVGLSEDQIVALSTKLFGDTSAAIKIYSWQQTQKFSKKETVAVGLTDEQLRNFWATTSYWGGTDNYDRFVQKYHEWAVCQNFGRTHEKALLEIKRLIRGSILQGRFGIFDKILDEIDSCLTHSSTQDESVSVCQNEVGTIAGPEEHLVDWSNAPASATQAVIEIRWLDGRKGYISSEMISHYDRPISTIVEAGQVWRRPAKTDIEVDSSYAVAAVTQISGQHYVVIDIGCYDENRFPSYTLDQFLAEFVPTEN